MRLRQIESHIINMLTDWYFLPGEPSKKALLDFKKRMREHLSDPETYLSINYHNQKITKLVMARFNNSPIEKDRIGVICFYFHESIINKKNISTELLSLKRFFLPQRLKLTTMIPIIHKKTYRILLSLGAQKVGTRLYADVKESLSAINKKLKAPLPKDYRIELMDYDRDIDSIMRMEYRAHQNEPSSVVHRMSKKDFGFFRNFLKDIAEQRSGFVLLHKNKVAGFIAHNKHDVLKGHSQIATISMEIKHKGLGLSGYLYQKVLQDMSEKKCKYYFGYTNTQQVHKLARKLKRIPYQFVYRIEKEQMDMLDD